MALYKGRYLIAIYDNDDNFIDCATSVKDLWFKNPKSTYSEISRGQFFHRQRDYKVYLIDCLEKHDDIFKEEDEIFLKEEALLGRTKGAIYKELLKKYNIGLRTLQRYLKSGKISLEKEMESGRLC